MGDVSQLQRSLRTAVALVALGLAGCADVVDVIPRPLEIASISPAAGATDVKTGATVAVTFTEAIDPASLTAETFQVKAAGIALPTLITYEAATQTARAVAPLLPNTSYQVEVTTEVRTPVGVLLSAAEQWSFMTRAWQSVTVDPMGDVGAFTSVAMDGSGRVHVSYSPFFVTANLKYATCSANCATATNWQLATVDPTPTSAAPSSLTVDGSGRLHLTYFDDAEQNLNYATCSGICTATANWQAVAVDAGEDVGLFPSVAVDVSGRLHASYSGASNGSLNLRYATCAANCTAAAGWQTVTVDATEGTVNSTSLAVDRNGSVHVIYLDFANGNLRYATCTANCTSAVAWQATLVDAVGGVGLFDVTSLAVDENGRVNVTYPDIPNRNLKYATCAANCATAANWELVTIDNAGDVGSHSSLAVDGGGRRHVGYVDSGNQNLKYATCAANCATAANWRAAIVDATGDVGQFNSLAVDGSGRVRMTYSDFTNFPNQTLRYIE